MSAAALRRDETAGLILALAAHGALVAWLVLAPPAPKPFAPPERMSVTLSEDVGLTSTSPEPAAQAAPDVAPEIGEAEPQPVAQPAPPKPEPPKPAPRVQPAPPPKPAPRAVAQPRPQPAPAKPAPARPVQSKPAPAKPAPAKPAVSTKPAGGSRIGNDFLKGVPGATTKGKALSPPAATAGPAVRSALAGAISRQLKPRWTAPQGIDAEKLVTYLTWDLNADGSLAGTPRMVRQEGITPANKAQAQRHAEQAIRAVRLAAPFQLPAEYFGAWKHITEFRFDRRLSQ